MDPTGSNNRIDPWYSHSGNQAWVPILEKARSLTLTLTFRGKSRQDSIAELNLSLSQHTGRIQARTHWP